jgi:hypothetical protein
VTPANLTTAVDGAAVTVDAQLTVTVSTGMTASVSMLPVDLGGTDATDRAVEVPADTTPSACRTWRETELPLPQ